MISVVSNILAQNLEPIKNKAVPDLNTANPTEAFGKFFAGIIALLLVGGTLWSFWQLLIGALEWISSGGDKGKLEGAQTKIRNAIVGLIILFASWAFFLLILQWLGISPIGGTDFNINIPKLL